MEKIMYKHKTMAVLAATALFATVAAASAQTVNVTGGGASIPATLYKGSDDSILPANFSYAVTGSGTGKKAFLENNTALFSTTGTVHFAGSDSVLSSAELSTYNYTYNVAGDANRYGPLIQVPSALMPIVIPFNKGGPALDLNVTQICGIFSGKINNWSQLAGSGRVGHISVVYRPESSGASEILTRFLSSACQPADVSGTTLKLRNGVPAFSVQSNFADVFAKSIYGSNTPVNFVAAPSMGDASHYNAVYALEGRIGYVGPDVVPNLADATRIATVKGFSPGDVNVQATIETVAPPRGAAADNPANWVPVFGNPSTGYPIVGYTSFVFGQCYKDVHVGARLRGFLFRHYNTGADGNNDAPLSAHGFIPLTKAWRDAIREHFAVASRSTALNNPAACNGIGRPL
jgi:ABC-type phosphate transport system substrate-binding protein